MKWEKTNLGEIIEIKKGKYITKKDSIPGPYPVILGGRVPAYYINQYNHTGKAIVVSRSGASAGFVSFWDEAIFVTDGFLIEPKENVDIVFLYYLMKSNEKHLIGLQGGAAIPHVTPRTIGAVEIELPPLNEQYKIVNILSAYDDLIENNQKQIRLLEEAAQRLYKDWFVDFHFPGHETVKVVDGVPVGWKKGTINNKISLLSGYAFKSSKFVQNGRYKIVTIKNVKDGQFEGINVSRISEIPGKMPSYCRLNEGDILLSLTGNVGRVCIVYGKDFLLNQRVAKFKSNMPGYTYCLFRSKDIFDKMNNLANGAAQQNLSPIRTGQIRVLFPSDDLILQFEKVVQPILCKIIVGNKKIKILSEARNRLLPRLMGKQ